MNVPATCLLVVLLAGCSWIAPENEARVTEYRVSGLSALISGGGEGVRVVNEGVVKGCLEWKGDKGIFRSSDCPPLPEPPATTTITGPVTIMPGMNQPDL